MVEPKNAWQVMTLEFKGKIIEGKHDSIFPTYTQK
jgi:hypothetical protein